MLVGLREETEKMKVGDLVRYKISEVRSYHTAGKIALARGKVPLLVVCAKKRQRRKQTVYFFKVLQPDGSIVSARSSDITKVVRHASR